MSPHAGTPPYGRTNTCLFSTLRVPQLLPYPSTFMASTKTHIFDNVLAEQAQEWFPAPHKVLTRTP
jgi:hypothetical protein